VGEWVGLRVAGWAGGYGGFHCVSAHRIRTLSTEWTCTSLFTAVCDDCTPHPHTLHRCTSCPLTMTTTRDCTCSSKQDYITDLQQEKAQQVDADDEDSGPVAPRTSRRGAVSAAVMVRACAHMHCRSTCSSITRTYTRSASHAPTHALPRASHLLARTLHLITRTSHPASHLLAAPPHTSYLPMRAPHLLTRGISHLHFTLRSLRTSTRPSRL
jgi:hypothetical protein